MANMDKNRTIIVDIAWGGMWYAIVDIEQLKAYKFALLPEHGRRIAKLGEMIKVAVREQHSINLNEYYVQTTKNSKQQMMDYPGPDILCFRCAQTNTNAVVMSNNELKWTKPETWTAMIDRSPCGTGTAAVMAMLHQKNGLRVGEPFVHKSIINTQFVG